ncbi:MAG: nucleotidyl transferase AbiEii/AbiGii toxin family protein [bacterium]|nr:nucleotidyl transferase AbiEii/AbiGii toxin family protein [bacterium]
MLLPKPQDAQHRLWLYRLLSAIVDDDVLSTNLKFKGGTCAAMRNILDRFSIDLDFDLIDKEKMDTVRIQLETIFAKLDLEIKDASTQVPQYFLRYPTKNSQERNTIKIDVTTNPPTTNTYEIIKMVDIDRFVPCQTIPTIVANKLVTPVDRFAKTQSIAGRDIYDIHVFLSNGLPYNTQVIEERAGVPIQTFFGQLAQFIEKHVTQTIIDQDLNTLLDEKEFQRIRTSLKQETLMLVTSL